MKAIDVLLFTTLLSGCALRTGSEAFLAPEIVQADAVVVNQEVRLRCSLSAGRAERCGFFYGPAEEELQEVPCLLEGDSFELQIDHLTPGQTYEWYAYASAGGNEIRSEVLQFSIDPLSPHSEIIIPDPAFREYLLQRFDFNADGVISLWEAESVRRIEIAPSNHYNLQSLQGIEFMPNLEEIICWGEWYDTGNKADGIDREHYYIGPYRNSWETAWGPLGTLKSVDVSHNPKLRKLFLENNSALGVEMQELDVSHNPELKELLIGMTWLNYPDISANQKLEIADFGHLKGTVPDFYAHTGLRELNIDFPQDDHPELIGLDVSHMPDLEKLVVSAHVHSLSDLSANPRLRELHLGYCSQIDRIDLSENAELEVVNVSDCNLSALDVSKNPKLKYLHCGGNRIRTLDVSHNCMLGTAYGDQETGLWCRQQDDGNGKNLLDTLYVAQYQTISHITENRSEEHVPDETVIVRVQEESTGIQIEDPVFRSYLLEHFDTDRDGGISISEALRITDIAINTDNVRSLRGIEQMPNLTSLFCRYSTDDGRGGLTELDVSGNPKLTYLDCSYNRLRHLDVKNLRNLTSLHCNHNLLEELDITANLKLCILCANSNRLTAIDVSGNPLLTDLHVDENRIETLDLSHNLKLKVDDTYLSPMEDERGNNLLKTLYLDKRQSALSVRAPKETQIIYL